MFGGGFAVNEPRAEVADDNGFELSSRRQSTDLPSNSVRNSLSAPETSTDSDDETNYKDAREVLTSPESQTSLVRAPKASHAKGCDSLIQAIKFANLCKRRLPGNTEEGLNLLMVACFHSVYALGVFRNSVKSIVKAIALVGATHARIRDQVVMIQLDVTRGIAWSAHALLCAYREVEMDFDTLHAMEPTTFGQHLMGGGLNNTMPDGCISWVHAMSRLKMYWTMFSSPESEYLERQAVERQMMLHEAGCSSRKNERAPLLGAEFPKRPSEAMLADITCMLRGPRPNHPATLQAVHLWQQRLMLQQQQQQQRQIRDQRQNRDQLQGPRLSYLPYHYHASPDMTGGFRAAVLEYEDPATAMQHLLFCMYEGLRVCDGKPDSRELQELTWAADQVLHMHQLLTHVEMGETGESLWEIVSERLVVAMLLLARSFDLQKILKDHPLPLLMLKEKKMLSDMYQELAEHDALTGFASSDSDSDDDREHQCSVCRNVRKKVEMFICSKCRKVIYCSKDCMRKNATAHKQLCLQVQLRQRQNQKTSRNRV